MKLPTKIKKIITCCMLVCMLFPHLMPLISYADNSSVTFVADDVSTKLETEPYENDLGIMLSAVEITNAFGMTYYLDEENKTFTINTKNDDEVILMHNATKFSMGDNIYNCEAYFYFENGIPMVELGFFCDIFDFSYQYDEKNKTIFVTSDKALSAETFAKNTKSSSNLKGVLSVSEDDLIPDKGLEVSLYLTGVETRDVMYHGELLSPVYEADKHDLMIGKIKLTKENPSVSFDYNVNGLSTEPYYQLMYRVENPQDKVAPKGFVNRQLDITETDMLSAFAVGLKHGYTGNSSPNLFLEDESYNVDITLPALEYNPCGDYAEWEFEPKTKTLYIKGRGMVTKNEWNLISEYVENVVIGEGITTIVAPLPEEAIVVHLPDSIITLGYFAFSGCMKLESIVYSGSNDEWDWVTKENKAGLQNVDAIYNNLNKESLVYFDYDSFDGAFVTEFQLSDVQKKFNANLAIYDENDKIVAFGSSLVNEGDNSVKITIPFDGDASGEYYYKLMFWESGTFIPYVSAICGMVAN